MGWLSSIFSSGASSVVEAVGDAIDKTITSDEERLALENEMAKAKLNYELEDKKLDISEQQIYLKDTQSARDNQSRVQESAHSSWLAKNVHPILALGIVGLTFFLYYWIIMSGNKVESGMKDIIIYILGALTTISTQVVAYFFGSSQGSKDKQKTLAALTEQKVH